MDGESCHKLFKSSEILEKIFSFLPFETQNVAMQICKMWFDVLQLSKFTDQICLAFQDCYINEKCDPMTTFLKTKRIFKHLRIGEGLTCLTKNEEFWQFIGANVETVKFTASIPNVGFGVSAVLAKFTKLEEIKLFDCNSLTEFDIPKWVKRVNIEHNVPVGINLSDTWKILEKKGFKKPGKESQLKSIFIHGTFSFYAASIEDLPQVFNFDFPRVTSMSYNYKFKEFNLLEPKKITPDMVVRIEKWNRSPLDKFINLEELSMTTNRERCFFGHNPQLLGKLRKVIIKTKDYEETLCETCIEAMITNCPKVDSLEVSGKAITNLQSVINSKRWRNVEIHANFMPFEFKQAKLESLIIKLKNEELVFECQLLANQMPNLKTLEIGTMGLGSNIKISSVSTLVETCPNLQSLSVDKITMEQALQVEQFFPNLLIFQFRLLNGCEDETLIKSLKGNFWKLKVFGYPYRDMCGCRGRHASRDVQMQLYEKIPTLRQAYCFNYDRYQGLKYGWLEYSSVDPLKAQMYATMEFLDQIQNRAFGQNGPVPFPFIPNLDFLQNPNFGD